MAVSVEYDNGRVSGVAVTTERADGWTFRLDAEQRFFTIGAPPDTTLDAEMIRALPIGKVISEARGKLLEARLENLEQELMLGAREGPGNRPERAARMYRLALSLDLPPLDAMAKAFGRSVPAVKRYVAEARAEGLLGSAAEERAVHGWPVAVRKKLAARAADRAAGIPVPPRTPEALEEVRKMLSSPEHRKATGRSPGRGSTQRTDDN